MKGLLKLADIKSKHITGIKISRMNDLVEIEDGNPLEMMKILQ